MSILSRRKRGVEADRCTGSLGVKAGSEFRDEEGRFLGLGVDCGLRTADCDALWLPRRQAGVWFRLSSDAQCSCLIPVAATLRDSEVGRESKTRTSVASCPATGWALFLPPSSP